MDEALKPAFWSPVWDSTTEEQPARYPTVQGKRVLLPCPVLFYGGLYEYVLIDVHAARRWMLAGPVHSYISHPFLHAAFEWLMGFFTPPAERGPLPALSYHDDALCFVVDTYDTLHDLRRGDSKKVQELVEAEHYTIGLLRRLA